MGNVIPQPPSAVLRMEHWMPMVALLSPRYLAEVVIPVIHDILEQEGGPIEWFQRFLLHVNIYARDPDFWNVVDQPPVDHGMENWMSRLPGQKPLAEVALPGTHETMARDGLPNEWCQSLSLLHQLIIGIRFFDISCRHFNDGLPIYHGTVYQNTNFTACVRDMVDYLKQHGDEVIIMRVKEEYKAANNTKSFAEAVDEVIIGYKGLFWKKNKIPKLSDVRGKIVILQDFDSNEPMGIRYGDLVIADGYTKDHDEKCLEIMNNLKKGTEQLKLTFSSSIGSWQTSIPSQFARSMNPVIHDYVRYNQSGSCFGIIAMDYPGPKLVRDIVKQNFR